MDRKHIGQSIHAITACNALTIICSGSLILSRRRSGLASTLLACLELARDGKIELRQLRPFDEIYVRDRGVPRVQEAAS